MRFVWLVLVIVAIGGCPAQPGSDHGSQEPEAKVAYPEFTAALSDEDGFRDELKRLQELYTSPAGLGHSSTGISSVKYKLKGCIEDGRVGLEIYTEDLSESWLLWIWQGEGLTKEEITVVEDGHTAGGYRLEFNIHESVLTVNINARWLQGRYLQISRELILGGVDHTLSAPDGSVTWELEGEWLPYRMIPGATGPYGVVPDVEADGDWHERMYPDECMAPSVAAYDRDHGLLLTIVDEHPRRLDRIYQVEYSVPLGYGDGSQARISTLAYDSTIDEFKRPWLFSGLPVRESIVIEPFELYDRSEDPTLVYAETDEVIRLLGQTVRAFHFDADPPERALPGGFITASDWIGEIEDIPEFLRNANGIWDVRYSDARLYDGALADGGNVGIGVTDLDGGVGLAPEVLDTLKLFQPEVMRIVADLDYLSMASSHDYMDAHPDWLITVPDGETSERGVVLEVRKPEVGDWLVNKMTSDLAAYPDVSGYTFEASPGYDIFHQDSGANGYLMSWDAASAAVVLKTAEALRETRDDALIVTEGQLNLAVPEFGQLHHYGEKYYLSDTTYEIDHARRFAPTVLWEIFEGASCIDYGDSPALQVIASSRTTYGHRIHESYRDLPGFVEYAKSQRQLREAAGEVLFLHCNPLQSTYTMGSERPAVCDQIVAILPANWESASMFWVAFHGTGGSLEIDEKNMMTITWDTGGKDERKLPPGYWVTEYPDPQNIPSGDVVVIERCQVSLPDHRGGMSL